MKYLLSIIILFCSTYCLAQEYDPPDTPGTNVTSNLDNPLSYSQNKAGVRADIEENSDEYAADADNFETWEQDMGTALSDHGDTYPCIYDEPEYDEYSDAIIAAQDLYADVDTALGKVADELDNYDNITNSWGYLDQATVHLHEAYDVLVDIQAHLADAEDAYDVLMGITNCENCCGGGCCCGCCCCCCCCCGC